MSATRPEGGGGRAGVSFPDLVDYQAQAGAFDALVGVQGRSLTFSDTDEPERVLGAAVNWRLFSMLGIAPALGRDFTADDDRAGALPSVVMLSDELWRRRYNGDPAIVGRAGDRQRAAVHRDRRAAAAGQVPVPAERVDSR